MATPTFPTLPGLGLPITRTPMWATLDQVSLGGVNAPQEPWTYPRYRYRLPYEFLRQAAVFQELQTLMGFFNQVGGKYGVFQYNDPQDSTSGSNQSLGVADGVTTTFQLLRTRGSFVEPVFAPSTVSNVLVGGSSVSSTTFTVDTKGVLTFSTSSIPGGGSTIAWNGSFNWYCRFDQDEFDFEQFTINAGAGGPLWTLKELSFTTIKFGA